MFQFYIFSYFLFFSFPSLRDTSVFNSYIWNVFLFCLKKFLHFILPLVLSFHPKAVSFGIWLLSMLVDTEILGMSYHARYCANKYRRINGGEVGMSLSFHHFSTSLMEMNIPRFPFITEESQQINYCCLVITFKIKNNTFLRDASQVKQILNAGKLYNTRMLPILKSYKFCFDTRLREIYNNQWRIIKWKDVNECFFSDVLPHVQS